MIKLTKEMFQKLLEEAALELDKEIEDFVKHEIKVYLKQVGRHEALLENFKNQDLFLEDLNNRIKRNIERGDMSYERR